MKKSEVGSLGIVTCEWLKGREITAIEFFWSRIDHIVTHYLLVKFRPILVAVVVN